MNLAAELIRAVPLDETHVPIRAMETTPCCDPEIAEASRQAFTAYELAMRRGHHPRLWHAVKGSPFQSPYEMNLGRQS
jgi:hypothetical protein